MGGQNFMQKEKIRKFGGTRQVLAILLAIMMLAAVAPMMVSASTCDPLSCCGCCDDTATCTCIANPDCTCCVDDCEDVRHFIPFLIGTPGGDMLPGSAMPWGQLVSIIHRILPLDVLQANMPLNNLGPSPFYANSLYTVNSAGFAFTSAFPAAGGGVGITRQNLMDAVGEFVSMFGSISQLPTFSAEWLANPGEPALRMDAVRYIFRMFYPTGPVVPSAIWNDFTVWLGLDRLNEAHWYMIMVTNSFCYTIDEFGTKTVRRVTPIENLNNIWLPLQNYNNWAAFYAMRNELLASCHIGDCICVNCVCCTDDACPCECVFNLTVTVVDDRGRPLPGATVTVTDSDGTEHTLTTGPDGTATFPDFPPSGYEVTVTHPDFPRYTGIGSGTMPEDDHGSANVTLSPPTDHDLTVYVVDNIGAPVEGAEVTVVGEDGETRTGITGPGGYVLFPNFPPGDYTVTVTHSDFPPGGTTGTMPEGEDGIATVPLTPAPGNNLTVYVINEETGQPIPDAEVTIIGPDGVERTGRTNDDGSIVFGNLPPGDYTITVTHPDFPNQERDIIMPDGNDYEEFFLIPSEYVYDLTVYVVDNTGAPVADAEVTVVGENGEIRTGTTDAFGRITFPGFPPGDYTVTVTHPDFPSGGTTGTMPDGENGAAEVILGERDLTITVRDRDNNNAPVPGATVTVTDSRGHTHTGTTGPDGTVTFPAFPPGEYTVTVTHPDFPSGGGTDGDMPRYRNGYNLVSLTRPAPPVTRPPDTITPGVPAPPAQLPAPAPEEPGQERVIHHAYLIGFAEDGTIRPRENINRAQVATIFFRLISDSARAHYWMQTNPFPDVVLEQWFNNGVSTTTNASIFVGMPDGTFQPMRSITRAELAATIVRFMDGSMDNGTAQFNDIDGHWAHGYINTAANNGWVRGDEGLGGRFRPDAPITRAETTAMINRMLQRLPETPDDLLPDMVIWPDNMNESAWYYLYIQEATNTHYYVMKADGIHETWEELLEPRMWQVLERPYSRPEHIFQGRDARVID